MTPSRPGPLTDDAIERLARRVADSREFRGEVLDRLHAVVEFDWYVWMLTDPVSCVGVDPVASIPAMSELQRTVRLKYVTAVNRWTAIDGAAQLGERAVES